MTIHTRLKDNEWNEHFCEGLWLTFSLICEEMINLLGGPVVRTHLRTQGQTYDMRLNDKHTHAHTHSRVSPSTGVGVRVKARPSNWQRECLHCLTQKPIIYNYILHVIITPPHFNFDCILTTTLLLLLLIGVCGMREQLKGCMHFLKRGTIWLLVHAREAGDAGEEATDTR